MINKKSVVLSDTENTNKKAVLTLQEHENGLDGTLRLYNFSRELDGVSSLGLYVNQKVYKAGLTQSAPMLYRFFIALEKIPSRFSCAVINFQNAQPKAILYGSSEGSDENIYGNIISEISQNNTFENAKNVLDKYGVDFEEQEKLHSEAEIDKNLCKNSTNCANCIYRKHFFEDCGDREENEQIEEDSQTESQEEQKDVLPFFERLKPQIDKLFEKNPIEEKLQDLIPDSKWIKVEYEDDGDFYVFGLIYDKNENVRYVCYGVPAVYEEEPPQELSGEPVWTPLDKTNEKGFGYWLTYQDAETGEPVKIVVD